MNDSIAKVFARRLRQERVSRGLSQTEFASRLAERLGVATYPTTITKIEKGEREIKLGEAIAIAEILDLPLSALTDDKSSFDDEIASLHQELDEARTHETELYRAHQAAQRRVRSITRRLRALSTSAFR